MKVRSGFVSNSSSSSFCVLGKEINKNEIDFNENVYCKIYPDWAEGNLFFKIDPELLEFLQTNETYKKYSCKFFIVYAYGEYNVEVKRDTLPELFKIYSFEIAHTSGIESVKDLESYLE